MIEDAIFFPLFRYSSNVEKRVSFYLLVEGKEDPLWTERLELEEIQEEAEEFHTQLKEAAAETRKQIFQAKRMQWMRRTSMSKDIIRMEALNCELLKKEYN